MRNQKEAKGLKVTLVEIMATTSKDVVSTVEVMVLTEEEKDEILDVKEVIILASILIEVEAELEVRIYIEI